MPCATSAETPIFLGLDWAEAPIPLWHISAGSRDVASHAWEGEWLVRRTSEAMPVGKMFQTCGFATLSESERTSPQVREAMILQVLPCLSCPETAMVTHGLSR